MQNIFVLGRAKKQTARIIAVLLAVCTLLTGIPLSSSALQNEISAANSVQLMSQLPFLTNPFSTEIPGSDYVDLEADSVTFQPGQILLQEKDFCITTKSLSTRNNGYIIVKLTVKNTGTVPFYFHTLYSKVEGYDVDTVMVQTLQPGQETDIMVNLDALPLAAVGISMVHRLDILFEVVHNETYKVLYENCSISIPLGVPINMTYTPCETCVYQEDAFALYLLGSAKVENRFSPSLIFRLDNNLDDGICVVDDGDLTINNTESIMQISSYASAYRDAVFSVDAMDHFFDDYSGTTAQVNLPVQLCTDNRKPLVHAQLNFQIKSDGTIQNCTVTADKDTSYNVNMQEYGENKNLFMGMFHNYKPDPDYVSVLKKKYPETENRYYGSRITPYVSELLTLYLDKLEEEGYRFGIVERPDMCSEQSYVVELTENGRSVIQVAFTIPEYDPKAAWIMTLGCRTDNYQNLDQLNSYLNAMWAAYDTLNVHMTKEKYDTMMERSETTTSDVYGTMLRGENDGLAYIFCANPKEYYLSITPDFSISALQGMPSHDPDDQYPTADLNVGDIFTFGKFEQDNVATNGAEDIQWIVIAEEVGKILAVSVQGLDARQFHPYSTDITWKDCALRTWLNVDFYNTAFTKQEQSRICAQEVEPMAGPDKVFLLSREETEAYLPTTSDRTCTASPYAVSHNAYLNPQNKCCWWLLRTIGTGGTGLVMSVNSDGTMDYRGGRVESTRGTVRPAIWISTTG